MGGPSGCPLIGNPDGLNGCPLIGNPDGWPFMGVF